MSRNSVRSEMHERKRRKLSTVGGNDSLKSVAIRDSKTVAVPIQNYLQSAEQWDLEQHYESRPRKLKLRKESNRLPIKNQDGSVEQIDLPERNIADVDTCKQASSDQAQAASVPTESNDAANDVRPTRVIVQEAKEEMARTARLINQDPEEYISRLNDIADRGESSSIVAVKKLALVTQLAIFKDVIPGYRIRPLTQDTMTEKISKEVRKIRDFEQSLLNSYQRYVNALTKITHERHKKGTEPAALSQVALACVCTLVTSVSQFNFYDDLLKILINKLSRRNISESHLKCVSTLEELFANDEEGIASQEAVTLLARMMKSRNYKVDESVIHTFLHLRLLNEFAFKASASSVDGDWTGTNEKRMKRTWEFRTKRRRKALKEMKAAEKEFQEADASIQRESRDRAQAETLKLVFGIYFRVLKTREPQLMTAVLEGLARYAHLINQDFFGDLLVAMQELATEAIGHLNGLGDDNFETHDSSGPSEDSPKRSMRKSIALRSALLCTTTAFALLSSQDAATLNIDLSTFANILYDLLLYLSLATDLEVTSKTPRLPHLSSNSKESLPQTKVYATALSTLFIRALTSSLSSKATPPIRLAAFTHRMMLASLHVPEKTSEAIIMLLGDLANRQGRKIRGLWSTDEQRGDGKFEALSGIGACRPFCGTIWQGELLRLHYAAGVREGQKDLEKIVKGLA